MKNNTAILTLLIISISLLLLTGCSSSKNIAPLEQGEAFKLVDLRQFTFVADQVLPLRGRTRYLTSDYTISVNNDSLVSYLPYFGRATQAPMNPSESGLQFTSTNFSYNVAQRKNKQKEITIIPENKQGIQQLFFVIFENGSGSLSVTSTFRDPISFNGHIRRVK